MSFTAYSAINLCSAVLIGALGVVLAGVRIPSRSHARHYRLARIYLCVAFFLLALIKFAELMSPGSVDSALTGCVALVVAGYQALCFTALILLLIRPREVSRRRVWTYIVSVTVASGVLLASHFVLPQEQAVMIMVAYAVLYVLMLVRFTLAFEKAFKRFRAEMYEYYQEEDLDWQLRWISYTFFTSLAVGCMVFLSLSGKEWLDIVFIVVYSTFYTYLTIRFINYGQYLPTVMRALLPEADRRPALPVAAVVSDAEPVKAIDDTPVKYARISAALKTWVDERRYLLHDVAVKDVAEELGTTPRRLNEYFGEVVGEDFVKWRIKLRLSYARSLIDQDPRRSVSEVAAESGFGDRSYFYRKFAELQGITVTEYKRKAALQLAQQLQQQSH